MLHRKASEGSGGNQPQEQEHVRITLPNGESQEFSAETWTSMMEGIQSNCAEYFKDGPQELRQAYEQLLALATSVIHQTEAQKVS